MFTTDKAEIMRIAKKIAWDTANIEIPEEDELHMSEVDALNLLGRDGAFELIRYTYLYGYMRGRKAGFPDKYDTLKRRN